MNALAILLIGYSIFCAISIGLTHLCSDQYQDQWLSRVAGLGLLAALSVLQVAHFAWLYADQAWVERLPYRLTLFVVAPSFHLFSRALVRPKTSPALGIGLVGHFLPVALAPFLPDRVALPAAFLTGAGYLLWLGNSLFSLRHERARFRSEITLLSAAILLAMGVSVIGLVPSALPGKSFFSVYASAIGLAFLLVQTTLSLRPQLSVEVREIAQNSYASTTLARVDCSVALTRLDSLMSTEKIFVDPGLSLSTLAAQLGLSSHQLSELLNTKLGKSFSRYLRELRVDAARRMLCDEPSASVLSVGLSVGFTSQSNFYEAFREIEGTTPGQYRKLHLKGGAPL